MDRVEEILDQVFYIIERLGELSQHHEDEAPNNLVSPEVNHRRSESFTNHVNMADNGKSAFQPTEAAILFPASSPGSIHSSVSRDNEPCSEAQFSLELTTTIPECTLQDKSQDSLEPIESKSSHRLDSSKYADSELLNSDETATIPYIEQLRQATVASTAIACKAADGEQIQKRLGLSASKWSGPEISLERQRPSFKACSSFSLGSASNISSERDDERNLLANAIPGSAIGLLTKKVTPDFGARLDPLEIPPQLGQKHNASTPTFRRQKSSTSQAPTQHLYPGLPRCLFSDPGRGTFAKASNNRIHTTISVVQHKGGLTHASFSTTIPGVGHFVGEAVDNHASDARVAIIAAYYDLIHVLHERNQLQALFNPDSKMRSLGGPVSHSVTPSPQKQKDKPKILIPASTKSGLTSGRAIMLILRTQVLVRLRQAVTTFEQLGIGVSKIQGIAATLAEEEVRTAFKLRADQRSERNLMHQNRVRRLKESSEMERIRNQRESLPMLQFRGELLELINNNTYSIVVGATGSGKSTQLPQIILEHWSEIGQGAACNIICTQPRRIAAISVAERVAEERGEALQESVGYSVRFNSRLPLYGGSIGYCTTGVLLQRLQGSADEVLDTYSHIVIDEAHERDINIDFMLNVLRHAMDERRKARKTVPRVVIMSATLDTELFAKYFAEKQADGTMKPCPHLYVPGKMFKVECRYLEAIIPFLKKSYSPADLEHLTNDLKTTQYLNLEREIGNVAATVSNQPKRVPSMFETDMQEILVPIGLVVTVIAGICRDMPHGSVLVFLPGIDDLTNCEKWLLEKQPMGIDFSDTKKFKIILLHSTLPSGQKEVFVQIPKSCRKIILATNIAETSITLPDIKYVIDTGKHKEKRYDPLSRITRLQCTWVSKSSANQRRGRAGRVKEGFYYALYSSARYNSFRATTVPEIMRTDLQELCLSIKAHRIKMPIAEFFAASIEPPAPAAIQIAMKKLRDLDAMTQNEELTDLGQILAKLPVAPAVGKMVLMGMIFKCFDPILTLAATTGDRPLFLSLREKKLDINDAKLKLSEGTESDQFAMINAYRRTLKVRGLSNIYPARKFANNNFINYEAFSECDRVKAQMAQIFAKAGMIENEFPDPGNNEYGGSAMNSQSDFIWLIKAVMIAGYHPSIAVMQPASTAKGKATENRECLRTSTQPFTQLHPSSINTSKIREDIHEQNTLFCFNELSKSSDGRALFLRDTTVITPLATALLGGKLEHPLNSAQLTLDNWLSFWVTVEPGQDPAEAASLIMKYKSYMDKIISAAFAELALNDENAETSNNAQLRAALALTLSDILDWDGGYYKVEMERKRDEREEKRRAFKEAVEKRFESSV